jgi:thiamine monophosphate kinase
MSETNTPNPNNSMANFDSVEEMAQSISKIIPNMEALQVIRGQIAKAVLDSSDGKIQDKMIAAAKTHAVVDLAEIGLSVISEMLDPSEEDDA